jgi:spore coat protein JB
MYNHSNYNQNDYNFQSAYEQNERILPHIGYNKKNHTIPNIGYEQNIFNSYDGFIRGNMFPSLYGPYITEEPFKLTPQNEREALLDRVRELDFATLDLGLYLDTHPDDEEMIKSYNQYLNQEKQASAEYESRYGPLSRSSETLNTYPWAWIMPPWSWEVK